ncbi:MAG TPA: glycosyltransferase [Gemmatimonadaceae bacterium]|nr:glycosyltransferase [Gemmatimonadaceae bacterium]
MSAGAEPRAEAALSVVIVVFAGGRSVLAPLESLQQQTIGTSAEVIVVAASDKLADDVRHDIGEFAKVVVGPAGAHPAHLRSLGVRAARGRIIACTEDHCVPASDWCAKIIAAHEADAQVIGGAIQKLTPDHAIAWAAYLLEYGRYMPPISSGTVAYLSDCNVSYKRRALEEISGVWQDAFHETEVHDSIRSRWGQDALLQDPSILVLQSRRPALASFLGERFAHGRLFARLRVARYGLPARLMYSAIALGLTPLLVIRAVARALGRNEARTSALRALPYLTLAAASWSVGESVGALTPGHKE